MPKYNSDYIKKIIGYHEFHRQNSISLLASENVLSQDVKNALSSDLASRYSSKFYGGTRNNREIINYTEELARELFDVKFACASPISGHLSVLAAVNGLTKVGDSISIVDATSGGYPININALGRKQCSFPFDKKIWNNDEQNIESHFREHKPKLTLIGSSVIPYRYNLHRIVNAANSDNRLIYDGSHVLGLLAGEKFQHPLDDGFQAIVGSTHKSFPGPQGGIILSDNKIIFEKLIHQFSIQTHDNPFGKDNGTILVDNVHSNRIAALGISLAEMLQFGKQYAHQVIKNACELAKQINSWNVPDLEIYKNSEWAYTHSHQIISPMDPQNGLKIKKDLEDSRILVDSFLRIGTAEITRRGMKKSDMKTIAFLIKEAIIAAKTGFNQSNVRNNVSIFCRKFNERGLSYTFE